ncbi:MAG TPA: DUF1499 domain-containing protein [Candidatus Binatus sp.]|jgi:uncharacterized protein (DUF1499 family)|nr:DUF1499 domain-containing protein [Candidatus Binatus sp.]
MPRTDGRPKVLHRLGLFATAAAILGLALAWLRLVPALVGFALLALGGLVAIVVALSTGVQAIRGREARLGGLLAVVVAVVFVISAAMGAGSPMMNDYTTDLADPPAFHNAQKLPANAGRDFAYPPAFAEMQRSCCADLQPLSLPLAPDGALARARRVAERTPTWRITYADADSIEAISTSRLFGFQDDIVIRVRPESPGSSRVDMRSKSRDGKGDRGVNAARIRSFMVELARAQ